MSTYLRKCIDIAPTAVVTPAPDVANDYRNLRQHPWWPSLRATTSHLRLWADWPTIQRVAGEPPGFGAGAASLAALDAQVNAAIADGMQIVMLPYRYPRWANGTGDIPAGPADHEWQAWDRHARLTQYYEFLGGTRPLHAWKAFEYRLPDGGHGPDSQWGRYVSWLWDRYADRVTAFEVVNEPNLQLWPQRTTIETDDWEARWGIEGTSQVASLAVAEMMTTFAAIARRHPNGPLLLAPSTSDSDINTVPRSTTISHTNRHAASTDPFVESLLVELDRRGFVADDRWIWSYHDYSDVERKQHHVVDLRHVLMERGWAGRRLDGAPEVWCTEGGCRLVGTQPRFGPLFGNRVLTGDERRAYQQMVLTEALSRHHYAKGAGAGVGMVTQYTTYADPNFDSGILEPAGNGGAPRPSFAAWCAVPEYHAAPLQRAAWRPQF